VKIEAVQHKLANFLVDLEGLFFLVYAGAWEIAIRKSGFLSLSTTKVNANEFYQHISMEGIGFRGVIGVIRP